MDYEGIVYRPPSEARSLIIQVTIGCAHNTCGFCNMYKEKKFRIRSLAEILADLTEVSHNPYAPYIDKVFLADGDALVMKTEDLLVILDAIHRLYLLCRTARICSDSFLFFCILRVFYRLPRQREIHTRFQLQHRVVRPGIVQDRLQPCQPEIIAAVTDPVLICLAFSDLCHINLRARTIITVHIGIEPCHLFFDAYADQFLVDVISEQAFKALQSASKDIKIEKILVLFPVALRPACYVYLFCMVGQAAIRLPV